MRAIICIAIFGLAFSCQAQKAPKNEISFGYFTVGYFFDSTDVRFSEFEMGRHFNLQYVRHMNKHFSLGLNYTSCYYKYLNPPYPTFLENNTVIRRDFKIVSIHAGYMVSKWSMSAIARAGINYRFNGEKFVHYFYFGGGGPWVESVGEFSVYKEFGVNFGLSLTHPIFWKLFGEINCDYARMFPEAYDSIASTTVPRIIVRADPNQLLLSYRIGIRF